MRFLSRFGGYTKYSGVGGWVDQRRLIRENVAIVETFVKRNDWYRDDLKVRSWLREKLDDWKQASIGFYYNGAMYFVNRNKKRK